MEVSLKNNLFNLIRSVFLQLMESVVGHLQLLSFSFVLIAPNGEKQLVAIGAGRNAVIDGRVLTHAKGNVLIHMQSKDFFKIKFSSI